MRWRSREIRHDPVWTFLGSLRLSQMEGGEGKARGGERLKRHSQARLLSGPGRGS